MKATLTLILIPAYGRHYADEAQVRAAWADGKDFKILYGPYTSVRDVEALKRDWLHCEIFADVAKPTLHFSLW